jgi:CBS domain-containing protein
MTACLRDVLKLKESKVIALSPRHTVADAVASILRHDIGSVVVVDGDTVVGVVAERDLLAFLVTGTRYPLTRRLGVLLATKPGPVVAAPSVPVAYAMRVMTRNRQRHLPVCEGGRLVGVVSVGDVLHHMTREQHGQIVDMTTFVHGPCAATASDPPPPVSWHRYGRKAS